jgi:hypothetical protein
VGLVRNPRFRSSVRYRGTWGKENAGGPGKTYVATGRPEDRDYWTYAEGHFEKVGEGKWVEHGKSGKADFVEKKRSGRGIELYDARRNLTVILGDTTLSMVQNPFGKVKLTPLHKGQWGKAAAPKPVVRAKAEWVNSLAKMKIPEGVVAGKLVGQEFLPDRVEFHVFSGTLQFMWSAKETTSPIPDLKLQFEPLPLATGKRAFRKRTVPQNLTFRRPFGQPTVAHGWLVTAWWRKVRNNGTPQGGGFADMAYILEIGARKGDKLQGRIYICTSDRERSYLAGSFEATIK